MIQLNKECEQRLQHGTTGSQHTRLSTCTLGAHRKALHSPQVYKLSALQIFKLSMVTSMRFEIGMMQTRVGGGRKKRTAETYDWQMRKNKTQKGIRGTFWLCFEAHMLVVNTYILGHTTAILLQ